MLKKNKIVFLTLFFFETIFLFMSKPVFADNTWETAQDININQSYTNSPQNETNSDYYCFSISDAGETSLTFNHDYVDSQYDCWNIDVYNDNKRSNSLAHWSFVGNETTAITTDSLGLPAGTYYLVIDKGQYSNLNYDFKVNFTKSLFWEQEFNNTPVTATAISINNNYNGSVQFYKDEDYYLFNITEPGHVKISFEHDFVEGYCSDKICWTLYLYNFADLNTELLKTSFIGNATVPEYTQDIGLPTGKYIVKIRRADTNLDTYSPKNYWFSVMYSNFTFGYWEQEFNGNVSKANIIEPECSYNASLQSMQDEDWFLFTLGKNKTINISLYVGNDGINGFWRLNLFKYEDLNDVLLEGDFWGDTKGGRTENIDLQEGMYVIKVFQPGYSKSGNYSNSSYKFTVNCLQSINPNNPDEAESLSPGLPDSEQITVSDNKPMNKTVVVVGDYLITYHKEIPFYGKKLTLDVFGDITVSGNDGSFIGKVEKAKINKKTKKIQITKVGSMSKEQMKKLKKDTKGINGLSFSVNPYWVKDVDDVIVKINKAEKIKTVKIKINGKYYKAKRDEYSYDSLTQSLLFTGNNLASSYRIKEM